jgi:hypothetical protein
MRKAGIPDDVVAVHEPSTAIPLIQEEPDEPALVPAQAQHFTTAPVAQVVMNTASTESLDEVAQALIERGKGDKGKTLTLVDTHVQTWFDARKLSTKQAAAQGIERSEHNKPLWASAQDMRSKLKARVRQHFANEGGFVKRQVKARVPKSAVAEFLDGQGVDDPNVREFLLAFTKFTNAQRED